MKLEAYLLIKIIITKFNRLIEVIIQ